MRRSKAEVFHQGVFVGTLLTVTLLLSAGVAPASAQVQGAEIRGTIRDGQGGVLPGVTVTLRNEDSGVARTTVSMEDGTYRFAQLQPGRYSVTAELPGFQVTTFESIRLTVGFVARQDFALNIRAVEETVTVTAETPVVDVTQTEVASVVTQEQIETLPINSRNYLSLALLMPGTSTDSGRAFFETVNVGGSMTFNSTVNVVDGVMNNWAEDAEPRQNFPEAAVEEFKLNQSQYSAGYGLATGGVIQIVTKSGTNRLGGEVFEYFRDKSLNARNFFEDEKPDYRRHQFGATLGGPIVRDRTHFFATFERTDLDEFYTVNTGRPDLYADVEGTFVRPAFTNLYFARLDHQISPEQTLFVRYAQEDAEKACQGCGGTGARSGWDQQVPRKGLVVGHTWLLSDRSFNDFRFQWASAIWRLATPGVPIWEQAGEYPPERFAQQEPAYRFPSLSYGSNAESQGPESRWEFRDTTSTQIGTNHELRFGGEYSYMPYEYDAIGGWLGTWEFAEDQFFDPNDPASIAALSDPILFSATRPEINAETPSSYWGVFIEDEWRPRANLTVNYGLRYEQLRGLMNERLCGNLQSEPGDLPELYADLNLDPCDRGDFNNLGPRAGIAWDVKGDGINSVRGGYGIYYNHIRLLGNSNEQRNLRQFNVVINNPSYPDPFGGVDPTEFASTAPPNITVIANDYVQPYAQQFNVGFSHLFAPELALHLDGLYTRTRHDRKFFDLNPRDPITGLRPRPEWGRIEESRSVARVDYRAFYARLEKRFSDRNQFNVSYSLVKSEDDLPLNRYRDQANPDTEYGPSNGERRHAIVASGAVLLPYDLTLGAIWTYRSSLPFTAVAGRDINRNGFNDDFVPGTTRNQGQRDLDLALVNAWRALSGLPAVSEDQIEDTAMNVVDMRLSKTFNLGGNYRLEAMIQVFNLFNQVNLGALYSGANVTNALSASFGRVLTARDGRQAEIAVRFRF
ncbi:MAG: TonB-dependent receptor [Vicinamibacteria bacterium]